MAWHFDEKRIVDLRESRGLTQTGFAIKIRTATGKLMTKQQVNAWEHREMVPTTNTLVKISNIFGIVPAYWYVWTDDFEI